MNQTEVLHQFPQDARIWVYVTDRDLTSEEESLVHVNIHRFTSGWNAHEVPLRGTGAVLDRRIILLALDEGHHPASGCSIDKSVALMRSLQDSLQTDLFNRLLMHVKTSNGLEAMSIPSLRKQLETGALTADTPVVNTLAPTLGAFLAQTYLPLHQSWAAPRLALTANLSE